MLSSDYQYVFLDFETTGLSPVRDDIIQVGLIVTDAHFVIQKHFVSYINPGYEIEKLKSIVSYTTGILPQDIVNGISLEEFKQVMIDIIPDNAVFVGHNIGFDLKFLKKYIKTEELQGNPQELRSIDTIEWARVLIHYAASYSLDILYPMMREQLGEQYFTNKAQACSLTTLKNHDALSDCIIGIGIFEYSLKKLDGLCQTYGQLSDILSKADIFYLSKSTDSSQHASTELPILKFPPKQSGSTQLSSDTDRSSHSNGSKLYYGNMPIEQLIRRLSSAGKYIFATNSKQKLSIIKAKMQAMGLYNVSFVKEQQYIDMDKFHRIAQQDVLQKREALFFVKYCSHHLQGLGILDLNTPGDYKVYNYIRHDSISNKQEIILATHSALFSVLQEKQYMDYKVIFLDYEWRYASYLKHTSSPYDPVNFARIIDNYVYEYKLDRENKAREAYNNLLSLVDMFCGVLFMEIQNFIANQQADNQGRFEIGVMEGNSLFPKTNTLYKKILNDIESLQEKLPEQFIENLKIIVAQYEKLSSYMNNITYALPVVSDYTTYSLTLGNNFVDYSEFLQLLKGYKHYFFSNRNQTFTALDTAAQNNNQTVCQWMEFETIEALKIDTSHDKIFILNNNPTKAKKIFEQLMDGNKYGDYSILVENVTGGRGKNLAMAKSKSRYIMVGGYEMLLQSLVDKMRPQMIITCSQLGLLHQQIIADIQYRMR
ncbi:MAG: 3'-5' exonuclease [Candidatus Absconditabacterales bacterium]